MQFKLYLFYIALATVSSYNVHIPFQSHFKHMIYRLELKKIWLNKPDMMTYTSNTMCEVDGGGG